MSKTANFVFKRTEKIIIRKLRKKKQKRKKKKINKRRKHVREFV